MPKKIRPIHPGEILKEEFLIPFELTQYRLAKYFKTPPQFWFNLQTHCNLAI